MENSNEIIPLLINRETYTIDVNIDNLQTTIDILQYKTVQKIIDRIIILHDKIVLYNFLLAFNNFVLSCKIIMWSIVFCNVLYCKISIVVCKLSMLTSIV